MSAPVSSPKLDAAIAALEAYEPTYRQAQADHDRAEAAVIGLPPHGVEPPAALTVSSHHGMIMKFGDREVPVPASSRTYRTAEAIEGSDFPPARKAEMLAALKMWERQIGAAQRANGTLALIEAERAAYAVWEKALDERDRLSSEVLKAPVYSVADLERQLLAACAGRDVSRPQDYCCDEDKDATLSAVMRALRTIQQRADVSHE